MPHVVEFYFAPLVPLLTRCLLGVRWSWLMSDRLPEAAQDRDFQRSTIILLAGFSFAAIAALSAVEDWKPDLQLPIWFILVSFLAHMISFNVQSYKEKRWHNELAEAFGEVGSLSLTLALVSFIARSHFDTTFKVLSAVVALLAWAVDHCVRLWIEHGIFNEETERNTTNGNR